MKKWKVDMFNAKGEIVEEIVGANHMVLGGNNFVLFADNTVRDGLLSHSDVKRAIRVGSIHGITLLGEYGDVVVVEEEQVVK